MWKIKSLIPLTSNHVSSNTSRQCESTPKEDNPFLFTKIAISEFSLKIQEDPEQGRTKISNLRAEYFIGY
jgi:hypothetical protein